MTAERGARCGARGVRCGAILLEFAAGLAATVAFGRLLYTAWDWLFQVVR